MTLYEIAFKLQHECPFNNLSKKYPEVKMFLWCNRETEILEIKHRNVDVLNQTQVDIDQMGGVIRKSFNQKDTLIAMKTCSCTLENSASRNIDKYNCLQLPPVIFHQGWEHYRIVSFSHKDTRNLLDVLEKKGRIQILYKAPIINGTLRDSFCIPVNGLLSDLTEKQANALLQAYESGYYQIPRKTTTGNVSKRIGISRSTYEEHLKKAENKLVSAIMPYLKLRLH